MAEYAMHPTWGALDDALAPSRQEMLARLLAGKRGIDPGSVSITGASEERPWSPAAPASPAPAAPPVAPAAAAAVAPAQFAQAVAAAGKQSRIPTVYDTPYGEELKAADSAVKRAFWGEDQRTARHDQDVLTRLAEGYLSRKEQLDRAGAGKAPMTIYETPYGQELKQVTEFTKTATGRPYTKARRERERLLRLALNHTARVEGREDYDIAALANEEATENRLAGQVLDASAEDQAGIRKERAARVAAARNRFKVGSTIDRGEDGVWRERIDTETGESEWEEVPIPKKRAPAKEPSLHGLGAGGGVYFVNGRPQVIPPLERPGGGPAGAAGGKVPAGVIQGVLKAYMESDAYDPSDPDAMAKALLMLRQNGLLGGDASGATPPPSPAQGRIAVDPKTGRRFRIVNGKPVPVQ